VDCIVILSGQLFANTQIPCALWFLSKNRDGNGSFRRRNDEILFIDGRKLGSLIPGSRKQKKLSEEEIESIANVYRLFKRSSISEEVPGFYGVVSPDVVSKEHNYSLTPGRFVGSEFMDDDDFDQIMPTLVANLKVQLEQSEKLSQLVKSELQELGYDF
jgi:type I restriction enzyme M protein